MTEFERQDLIDKILRKAYLLTATKVSQEEIILIEVVEIIKNFRSDEH